MVRAFAAGSFIGVLLMSRWLHDGRLDTSRADELKALLASLVRPVDR